MKKFLINLTVILMLLSSAALAKTINAGIIEPISTLEPAPIYQLQVVDACKINKDLAFEEGAIITGNVIKVQKPKHWHRDAYILFKPTQYAMNDKIIDLTTYKMEAKIAKFEPIYIFGPATFVVLNTAEFMVPGITEICSFVNGYQKAEEHKIRSGFKQIYKDSPLAYPEKGTELEATKGDYVFLHLKID